MKKIRLFLLIGMLLPLVGLAQQHTLVTLPAGTPLLIRTKQHIDTDYVRSGNMFSAELAAPITAAGRVLIPQGSTVEGLVKESLRAKNIGPKASLTLELQSISHDPYWLSIQTHSLSFSGEKDDTGKITGGGAILGGVLDGFKGAVKGAAIGLGVSALTRGKQIHLPEGTLLEFELQAPVQIEVFDM